MRSSWWNSLSTPQATSCLTKKTGKALFYLYSASIMEFILKWRNHDVFERKSIPHEGLQGGLSRIFLEHWSVLKSYHQSDRSRANSQWCMPASGQFKLNCDAAVHYKHSVIVVVARDWRGNLALAHTKKVSPISRSKLKQKH